MSQWRREAQEETNEALCGTKKGPFSLCFALLWQATEFVCTNIIVPLPALRLNTDSPSDIPIRNVLFSESYIWAWEVSSGWLIQGSSQQLVPQDGDKVLGHDFLLLLRAMIFQRQYHRVSRHLSRNNHLRNKSWFNPYFQQLTTTWVNSSLCRTACIKDTVTCEQSIAIRHAIN